MSSMEPEGKRLPHAFMRGGTPSFVEFLTSHAPRLLPSQTARTADAGRPAKGPAGRPTERTGSRAEGRAYGGFEIPHGTTIVALACAGGVVVAGDRRSTAGNVIAVRDAEKVFRADEFSIISYAGSAGLGAEMIRLFQIELEHYEKISGRTLSLNGKANRLATLVRGNIEMAMQGLVVVPIYAGYDGETGVGRIFSYDYVGGQHEEWDFHSIGSGSVYAHGALKKLYRRDLSVDEAMLASVQALYDAADEDSATGGPDLARQIFPRVASVTADGFRMLGDEEVGAIARSVVEGRMTHPDGPTAPLR
jgi:proteasome beta subunit